MIISILSFLFGSGILIAIIKFVYKNILYKDRLDAGYVSEHEKNLHDLEKMAFHKTSIIIFGVFVFLLIVITLYLIKW